VASLALDLQTLKGRRVLVIGHTGFKGSWLSYLLAQSGAKVFGIGLPAQSNPAHYELLRLADAIDSTMCDIRNLDELSKQFRRIRPDVVFHLAAQAFVRTSYSDPYLTFSTNVFGSTNILECFRQTTSIEALVYVTSDKCYRNKEKQQGYVETDELGGIDPYSLSKAAAEMVYSGYVNSVLKDLPERYVASARAGNVIGGGDWSPDRLVPDCVRALQNSETIEIRYPGATRPWQHVLEPLSGYVRLAVGLLNREIQSGESWNFGPPEDSVNTVQEVADFISQRWKSGTLIHVSSPPSGMHEAGLLQLNSTKALRDLGWRTRWDFETTLSKTTDWYRSYYNGSDARDLTSGDIRAYLSS